MTANAFEVKSVSYHYEDAAGLDGVSLTVAAGEKVALLGANGSGKSTMLKILDGLILPNEGTVAAFGEKLTEETLNDEGFSKAFRRRVGFVFQNPEAQLFSSSVWEEIAFGPLHLGLEHDEIITRVEDTMHILGINHLKDRPPYHLSGGEKKKVALASVLAINPEVLLLDEPSAGLDPKTEDFLIHLISDLNRAGKTVITATQDLGIVPQIASRAIVLGEDHRLSGAGPAGEVLGDEELLRLANLVHYHAHEHDGLRHYHPHSHVEEHDHH